MQLIHQYITLQFSSCFIPTNFPSYGIPISIIHFTDDDGGDRRDMCPDIDELTRQCGSRECIRRPNDNERCPGCIMNCTG